MFPEYFSAGDDYIRYIKKRAQLTIKLLKCQDEEEKQKIQNSITKINSFIYAKDKPFKAAEVLKDFNLKYEEACIKLRQHTGGGKDIKDYTVIEYYTLLKVLEKESRKNK